MKNKINPIEFNEGNIIDYCFIEKKQTKFVLCEDGKHIVCGSCPYRKKLEKLI